MRRCRRSVWSRGRLGCCHPLRSATPPCSHPPPPAWILNPQKSKWWQQRKAEAESLLASKQLSVRSPSGCTSGSRTQTPASSPSQAPPSPSDHRSPAPTLHPTFRHLPPQSVGTLAVPQWQLGKTVSLDSLNQVTDAYLKSLEPSRKLSVPAVPATVKDSLAAFARSAGQDKSAGELVELVTKAMADKAVVVEDGKPVPGFQVRARLVLIATSITNVEAGNQGWDSILGFNG